ncbi:sensor histidine kinase [Paenibacillus sp. YSY-4.3]
MIPLRTWRNLMLQTKILIAFIFVLFVVIGLTCMIFYYENTRDTKTHTYSMLNTLSKQYSRTVDFFMDDIEKISLSIFSDPAIQGILAKHATIKPEEGLKIRNELFALLFNYAHPRPEIAGIRLYTTDHISYNYDSGSTLNAEVYLEEPWQTRLDAISKSGYLLLPPSSSSKEGYREKNLSLVRHIYRIPKRDKIGSLKIDINAHEMGRLLVYSGSDPLGEQMRVFIVTDEGAVIYDNDDAYTGQRVAAFAHALNADDRGEIVWQDKKYLYTSEKSGYTDWNILILLSNEFLVAKQQEAQIILIIVGLIAAVLASIVAYMIARHVTKPLRELITEMNRVERGDLSGRMDMKNRGELGVLSRVYNNMLNSISRLITEVYESKLAENNARLSALQAQINPHFLYNTLNIMKSISRLKGVEEVAEMSESLADLFKYTMKNLQLPVSLRQELEHVDNYMNIQKHRFGDRFELRMEVPEELMNASVLKLTVQPLVENAIIHGFSRKKSDARIDLKIYTEGELLLISVSDNGLGIQEQELRKLERRLADYNKRSKHLMQEDTEGIGLSNIHQRIQLLYGEMYGVKLASSWGAGTTVTLTFPYKIFTPLLAEVTKE